MTIPAWGLLAALGAVAAALIAWNLSEGARLSALPGASRGFRVLSGLCAFLVLPALLIELLAPSALGARIFGPLAWLWPLVALAVVVQAVWALTRGRSSAFVALPIALFDALAAWVAVARWADGLGAVVPPWALAPGMAVSSLAATALGGGAFPWAIAALMPVLAPAATAGRRAGRWFRAAIGTLCATVVATTAIEVPRAFGTLIGVPTPAVGAAAARGGDALAIGVRLFGTLSGAPSAATARSDVALADSLGVTALHVEFAADGATAAALDSVARSIEQLGDSVVLVVTLDFGEFSPGVRPSESALQARFAVIERTVRHLHPDVLVPAERIATGPEAPDAAWWQSFLVRAAATARRVDRDITLALPTDASTPTDSALVDWVLQGETPVDAIALLVRDHGAQPARFVAALDAMARWVSLARGAPGVWIVGVPAAPTVTGEAVQQQLVRGTLAWGASHSWVRGIIAGDASDGMTASGLRNATGRPRRALTDVGATLRALRDLPPATPVNDVIPSTDSLAAATRRAPRDSLTKPPP